VTIGLGLAAVGYAGRYLIRRMPNLSHKMTETMKKLDSKVKISVFLSFIVFICIYCVYLYKNMNIFFIFVVASK